MDNNIEEQLKRNFEGNHTSPAVITDNSQITSDFHDVPMEESPSKGDYYLLGTQVKVKSLSTRDIKNYSKMDVKSPQSVESHIDSAMRENVRVIFPNGHRGNVNDLTQFDKLHYLFLLREATMRNHKSKKELVQIVKHPKDPTKEKKVIIDQNVFEYYSIPSGIQKWYNDSLRCFNIFDDSEQPIIDIKIYIPTVGTTNWIKSYVRDLEIRKYKGEEIYYDEAFIKYFQFLVDDWRNLNEDYFNEKQKWFDELSMEANEVLIDAIDKISIGIKPNIKVDFDGEEVIVPINFRDYKSIFSISDRSRNLLSDTK